MTTDDHFVERRSSSRRAVYTRAVITHPRQTEQLSCIVRDFSQDGALLELPNAKDLPLSFWLRLEGEVTLRLCTVAWHSVRQLGVEFSQQIIERRNVERRLVPEYGYIQIYHRVAGQSS